MDQYLYVTTLFCDFPETNWFMATKFCNQALSTFYFNNNHMSRTGLWQEIFMTRRLSQTSRTYLTGE